MGARFLKSLWLFLFCLSLDVHAEQKITFGLPLQGRAYKTVENIRPLLTQIQDDLSHILGEDFKFQTKVFKNSELLSRALIEGKVDIARIPPENVIETYFKNKKISLLVIETKTTTKNNPFLIVSSVASGINGLNEMDGKSFAFGEQGSMAGEKLPRWILLRNLVLTDHLKAVSYMNDDEERLSSIAGGKIDAGIVSKEVFQNSEEREKLKVIFEYQGILDAWMVRGDFDPKWQRALDGELTQMRRTPGLEKIKRAGFVRGDLVDFEEVTQAGVVEEALLSQGLGKASLVSPENSVKKNDAGEMPQNAPTLRMTHEN